MELVQELQKELGCPACCTLPVEALGAEMQRAKQGGTVALRWRRDFDLVALATPAALDVGFIGEMRFIDTKDFRSYWIPGSWNVRMSYTDDISVPNPWQESNGAGQYQASH